MPTIVVTGRDEQVSTRNRQHAEEKIAKLEKYFDGIGKIEAILGHAGDEASVELVISVRRGRPIVCTSRAKDLYTAIDRVLDKAEIQLTKFKERLKAHRAEKGSSLHEGRSAQEAGRSGGDQDDGLESYDEVIEKRDF